jgi:hypothetical protein
MPVLIIYSKSYHPNAQVKSEGAFAFKMNVYVEFEDILTLDDQLLFSYTVILVPLKVPITVLEVSFVST